MVQVESTEEGHKPETTSELSITIRPFDSSMSRAAFVCSDEKMTAYFVSTGSHPRTLEYDDRQGAAAGHVLVDKNTEEILGFFTLSNLSIPIEQLPTNKLRQNQLREVSVTLLGRMAICTRLAGQGFGKRLLIAALIAAQKGRQYTGSTAIIVDPKRDDLVPFYAKFKFIPLANPPYPLRMFLPMAIAKEITSGLGL